MTDALQTLYEGWAAHQRLLVNRISELTAEQVKLRTAANLWTIWQLASHMAGSRIWWIHDVLGEGDAKVRDMFRMTSITVPGISLSDAGWEDDDTHPRTPPELTDALIRTWSELEACLKRWTPQDLAVEIQHVRPKGTITVKRQWVIWHLIEHDLHHSGEISQILGANGLSGLEL
ncbi:MAG: DinB family protein [Actinomycetota bacterium]